MRYLLLVLLAFTACVEDVPADLIIHNAAVWTVDEARPTAEAVAVRGNEIVAVGTDAEVLALRGDGTRVIDAGGHSLVPGFIDTHIHFGSAARFLEYNIMRTGMQDDFVARTRALVDRLPDGEWITGGFWGAYDQWAEGSAGGEARAPFAPDMRRVDAFTGAHPMFIHRFDRSAYAANAAALRAAGLDPAAPRADGVEFARDGDGYTGVMRGPGVAALFDGVVPETLSRQRRVLQSENALAEIARYGVTTVHDMSDDEQLAIYRALRDDDRLTARINYRYPLDRWQDLAAQGGRAGGDDWITLGALKGHIDGIMGTSSARFFEPYETSETNRGRWRRLMVDEDGSVVPGQFLQYMMDADSAGLQLTIHAIGDEANALLMDFLEEMNARHGERDRRFRLVHAQVIADEDFGRLGELGIIAEVQPYHLSDDMRWMEERIGGRVRGAYAFKRIADSGARLAFGSDWPGTSASEYPIDPMLGLYAATTRQTVSGDPEGGWFPDERISLAQALRAYTADAAYASFDESRKGRIAPGLLADLTLLDHDLFAIAPEDLLNVNVVATIVDGAVVYERSAIATADG